MNEFFLGNNKLKIKKNDATISQDNHYLFIPLFSVVSYIFIIIIMDFPVLYKRNPSLPVWTIWTIKVVARLVASIGNASPTASEEKNVTEYVIRITEGEFGGKQEIHDLSTTTNLEEACRSAQSEWNNQKEKEMFSEAMDIQHLVASLYPTPKKE
jgi:hypothetical protein